MSNTLIQTNILQWLNSVPIVLLSLVLRSLWVKLRKIPTREEVNKEIDNKIKLSLIDINQNLALMAKSMEDHTTILEGITETKLKNS